MKLHSLFLLFLCVNFSATSSLADDVDFDFSGIASPPGCSGSVVNFGQSKSANAVLMTNGHCVGMLSVPSNTIFLNEPYRTNVRLLKNRSQWMTAHTTQILYGTIHMYDIALVELDVTYAELEQKGVRSYAIAKNPLPIGSTIILATGYFIRATSCPILSIIPSIHEDEYRNINSYKYRDCNSEHGTSGSPLIDAATQEIVGMNYTGNDSGEQCTYNNPCEVDQNGAITVDQGAGYGDPVHQILTCLNANKELDVTVPTCTLPVGP